VGKKKIIKKGRSEKSCNRGLDKEGKNHREERDQRTSRKRTGFGKKTSNQEMSAFGRAKIRYVLRNGG